MWWGRAPAATARSAAGTRGVVCAPIKVQIENKAFGGYPSRKGVRSYAQERRVLLPDFVLLVDEALLHGFVDLCRGQRAPAEGGARLFSSGRRRPQPSRFEPKRTRRRWQESSTAAAWPRRRARPLGRGAKGSTGHMCSRRARYRRRPWPPPLRRQYPSTWWQSSRPLRSGGGSPLERAQGGQPVLRPRASGRASNLSITRVCLVAVAQGSWEECWGGWGGGAGSGAKWRKIAKSRSVGSIT